MQPYSAIAIANEFIELAERDGCQDLTNMKLQKLVYFAQGFALAMTEEPITFNNVHAFEWGPVFPILYKRLAKYGSGRVTSTLSSNDTVDEAIGINIIQGVWRAYGSKPASTLSSLTHRKGTPWDQVWSRRKYDVIPNDLIRDHYLEIVRPIIKEPLAA